MLTSRGEKKIRHERAHGRGKDTYIIRLFKYFIAVAHKKWKNGAMRSEGRHLPTSGLHNPQVNLTSGGPATIQCINGISNPGVIGVLLHFKPLYPGGRGGRILYLSPLAPHTPPPFQTLLINDELGFPPLLVLPCSGWNHWSDDLKEVTSGSTKIGREKRNEGTPLPHTVQVSTRRKTKVGVFFFSHGRE